MPPQTSRLANDHARGLVLAIVGILILSPDSLLVRLIAADQWTLLFWRGMMTFVTLTAFLLFSHRRDTLKRFHALGIKGLAIAALLALNTTLFVVSIRHTAVANTLVLVSVAPLLAAVFSSFFWLSTRHCAPGLQRWSACSRLAISCAKDWVRPT